MKEDILPDYRKKQIILYSEQRTSDELVAYGDKFLRAGRLSDTIEFYQKANHKDGLERMKDTARGMGDVMLYLQASKALDHTPAPEEWLAIGQAARDLKKYSFALQALEKGGDEKLLQETMAIVKAEGNAISI